MREENVTIRRLGPDDYDELLALWQRAGLHPLVLEAGLHPLVLEAGLHSLRPQGRDSRASIARQLTSGVQTILGLEVDGAHRGCGAEPGSAARTPVRPCKPHPVRPSSPPTTAARGGSTGWR